MRSNYKCCYIADVGKRREHNNVSATRALWDEIQHARYSKLHQVWTLTLRAWWKFCSRLGEWEMLQSHFISQETIESSFCGKLKENQLRKSWKSISAHIVRLRFDWVNTLQRLEGICLFDVHERRRHYDSTSFLLFFFHKFWNVSIENCSLKSFQQRHSWEGFKVASSWVNYKLFRNVKWTSS